MQYGMTFMIEMYDFENREELHVLTMPGDYIRMSRWADANLAGTNLGETAGNLVRNYATAWHALKRRGKTAEMGLPDELDLAGVEAMADRFSVYVNEMEDAALPLA